MGRSLRQHAKTQQRLLAVCLGLSVVLVACGDQGIGSLAIVRDSAGLRIVENPAVS